MNVGTFRGFLERVVFVHGYNVLETELFRCFSADFESADNLTTVYTVEEMAVVDKETGADATLGTETHEHHVETENLHVLYALAAGTLHRELELGAKIGRAHV